MDAVVQFRKSRGGTMSGRFQCTMQSFPGNYFITKSFAKEITIHQIHLYTYLPKYISFSITG